MERKQNRIQASLDKNHVEAMKMTLVNGSKMDRNINPCYRISKY
ncbi:hypothetical protein [Elizabethkingia miricola]